MSAPDNHMDDLFRRAADAYPLRDSGSEWEKISGRWKATSQEQDLPFAERGEGKKKRIAGIWWILLILVVGLAGGSWLILQYEPEHSQTRQLPKRAIVIPGNDFTYAFKVNPEKGTNATENVEMNSSGHEVFSAEMPEPGQPSPQPSEQAITLLHTPDHINKHPDAITGSDQVIAPIQSLPLDTLQSEVGSEKNQTILESMGMHSRKMPDYSITIDPAYIDKQAYQPLHLSAPNEATLPGSKSLRKQHQPVTWYGGVQTGLAVSTIEGQKLTRPGLVIGFFGGYHIRPTLSVETGLRLTRKNYFTTGDHFQMKNTDPSMPPDLKILSVKGSSNVFEIPLKLRYRIPSVSRGNYFVSAGINSFILSRETNDYLVFRNGVSSNMEAVYNNNHSYLAATLEISGGFEARLKNKHTLRIEPHIQMAIKGIGVGNLPVSAGGLLVGYSIFR